MSQYSSSEQTGRPYVNNVDELTRRRLNELAYEALFGSPSVKKSAPGEFTLAFQGMIPQDGSASSSPQPAPHEPIFESGPTNIGTLLFDSPLSSPPKHTTMAGLGPIQQGSLLRTNKAPLPSMAQENQHSNDLTIRLILVISLVIIEIQLIALFVLRH